MTQNDKIRELMDLHFDPKWGAPFWIERRAALPFDPCRDIHSAGDLAHFPAFPVEELASRPIESLIPRAYHDNLSTFITAETGGATGAPKRTAYHPDDFDGAFVAPFLAAADLVGFPRGRHWLFIGPSGPHIIGKAARACACGLGSVDPFSVDFDPRWVRKLPRGSLGHTRYLEHVRDQAMAVIDTQDIGVLFSTPPVLEALGTRMTESQRARIQGIHLGGMAASPDFWRDLTGAWFPNAVALSGYGNTLAGVCPQVGPLADGLPVYVPHGDRIVFDLEFNGPSTRGRVIFHRLDRGGFLPRVVEGDEASWCDTLSSEAVAAGFHRRGLANPGPAVEHTNTRQEGLY